jgi:hypothetical protein
MSSKPTTKSPPTVAVKPGGGRGPQPKSNGNVEKTPENSNGGAVVSDQSGQSVGEGAPFKIPGRRQGKRQVSGSSKTGLTPEAKTTKRPDAKYSGTFSNGLRVGPSPEQELAANEAEEENRRKKAVALRPKIRGRKKNKQLQQGNHAGKRPSNKNSNSVRGPASQINVGDVVGVASQPQPQPHPGPSGLQNSKQAPKAAATAAPAGLVDPKPTETNPTEIITISDTLESRPEAEACLDRERRNIEQPPSQAREVAIAAELLDLSLQGSNEEDQAPKKPMYASKLKASTEGIHSVMYLYSGVDDRIDLPEETFNRVIEAVEDHFMTLAREKVAFAKWKWFSWSDNRGLIAARTNSLT